MTEYGSRRDRKKTKRKTPRRVTIGCLGVLVALVVLFWASLPDYERIERDTRLRSVFQGLFVYAGNHNDRLPGLSEMDAIVDRAIEGARWSWSEPRSYELLMLGEWTMDPGRLLVSERPFEGEKNVLASTVSGEIVEISIERYNEALDER